ncbi:MAG: hypothetical protein M0026_01690 [Nocardiopsaceae bacterium]|nr:hypothetical protein [Nocardiopsaceae bacterium]
MALYEVHARKWQNGWELQIGDVGVTWSPTLRGAVARAREHISAHLPAEEHDVEIRVLPTVGDDLDRVAQETRTALEEAEEALRVASAKTRQAVYRLTNAGLSTDDVSHLLGLSPDQLHELVAD